MSIRLSDRVKIHFANSEKRKAELLAAAKTGDMERVVFIARADVKPGFAFDGYGARASRDVQSLVRELVTTGNSPEALGPLLQADWRTAPDRLLALHGHNLLDLLLEARPANMAEVADVILQHASIGRETAGEYLRDICLSNKEEDVALAQVLIKHGADLQTVLEGLDPDAEERKRQRIVVKRQEAEDQERARKAPLFATAQSFAAKLAGPK